MDIEIISIDWHRSNDGMLASLHDFYVRSNATSLIGTKDFLAYKLKEAQLENRWEFLMKNNNVPIAILTLRNTYREPEPILNVQIEINEDEPNEDVHIAIKIWLINQQSNHGFNRVIAYESRTFLEKFYLSLNGKVVNWLHFFELVIENSNHELLRAWDREVLLKNHQLKLVYHKRIPEKLFAGHARLHTELSKDILRKDYSWQVVKTEDYTRNRQELLRLQGKQTEIGYLMDVHEEIIGMTKMVLDTGKRDEAYQTITGLTKKYRGLGLAKLLKARMIKRILDCYPDVKRIKTDCLEGNYPMISINEKLGFRRKESILKDLFLQKN